MGFLGFIPRFRSRVLCGPRWARRFERALQSGRFSRTDGREGRAGAEEEAGCFDLPLRPAAEWILGRGAEARGRRAGLLISVLKAWGRRVSAFAGTTPSARYFSVFRDSFSRLSGRSAAPSPAPSRAGAQGPPPLGPGGARPGDGVADFFELRARGTFVPLSGSAGAFRFA